MRLLHILFLLLVGTAAHGQKFIATVGAGANVNTTPAGIDRSVAGDILSIGAGGVLQAKYVILRKYTIGAGVDAMHINNKKEPNYSNINPEPSLKITHTYRIGTPAINAYLIAERRVKIHTASMGIGFIGGLTMARNSAVNSTEQHNLPASNGFMLGVIAEADIKVYKRIYANIMTTPRYHSLKFTTPYYWGSSARFVSIPLTIGLSFHL